METRHLIISGKVQGVFYRASAKEKAMELNITGWIKNTPEGNVEAMISGEEESIASFIKWCRSGPDRATVSDVKIHLREPVQFETFKIER